MLLINTFDNTNLFSNDFMIHKIIFNLKFDDNTKIKEFPAKMWERDFCSGMNKITKFNKVFINSTYFSNL